MATAVQPPILTFPPLPTAKFHIGENEPLTWLISILFTEEFWQRDNLTRVPIDGYNFLEPKLNVKPKYESWPALYAAAENRVKNDPKAAKFLELAQSAIERGELSYYLPDADKWGDRPYYAPKRDVNSYQFLLWAEKNGIDISRDVLNASQTAIHIAVTKKGYQQQQAYAYPPITPEDFARSRKEPLWELATGLMYLMGRRSRMANKEPGYKGDKNLFDKLMGYALDAHEAGQLRFIKTKEEMPNLKVVPEELVAWAKTLPETLPMLSSAPVSADRPNHCTPDMVLMYDAIEQFWKDYDLAKPNPSVAPLKKDVVTWLMAEAKKRGIDDFSENRAKNMDTIIRCPKARLGGNTL